MKKIIGIMSALSLTAGLALAATACNNSGNGGSNAAKAPISFTYSLETAEDDTQFYALKGVTVSDAAQDFIVKKDFAGLAELFNTAVPEADYAAPDAAYTAETVTTFTVPSEYRGKEVRKVLKEAVVNQTFIKKLVVGDNIEEIEQGAFSGLTALEEVELPFVGASIGAVNEKKCFGYIFGTTSGTGLTACEQTYNEGTGASASFQIPTSLKTVTVTGDNEVSTETVSYDVKKDDDGNVVYESGKPVYVPAESGEYTVEIDSSTYAAAPYSFYNCSTVQTVNFTGTVEVIGNYTFYGCTSLREFSFPSSVTAVGDYAFSGCTALRTVDFGNVETIGEHAFSGCTDLGRRYIDSFNVVTISAKEIGESAFHGCTALDEIVFTASDAVIGDYAFHEATALSQITFASGTTIGASAFAGCTAIKSVDLTNVTAIGNYSFFGCSSLADVTNPNGVDAESAFGNTPYEDEAA